ncbi:glutamate 5-kinase [Caloramator sp. CAR-1]|uniref:glutamate 5-kinase n=1 Tax=Caloramator sp. CAR-1 TaxID=3062777 RepID=UPI0026E34A5F|nr:glutamate 5-kinase [Caloramator sp. CAR-1]MDO6354041.1 glutamate 5-kinase [Caloramator sp. CAR-1]
MERSEILKSCKRIVVKVGTSTLTYSNGLPNYDAMEKLIRQLANAKNKGYEIVLVTSGAIGVGMAKLKLKQRPKTIPEKQACAAVGQGLLMHLYEKIFSEYCINVAQILLTREDVNDRQRFLNARNLMFELIKSDIVPIINENDAVAVDEIKIGDNDNLSALVAMLSDADLLVILSDIDGLYDKDPNIYEDAKLISTVKKINDNILKMAGDSKTKIGTGGMVTKIQAAKIATSSGIPMIIAKGSLDGVITRILNGEEIGTIFLSNKKPLSCKRGWIAFAKKPKGEIYIDDGAVKALVEDNKSLLSPGIKKIEGNFLKGDCVLILSLDGKQVAKGLINYSSLEISDIMLKNPEGFNQLYKEIVHRDNMVIIWEE